MLVSESKLRVLVVDDEFVIASTWSQILRMSGFETDMATSGEDAIRKAAQKRPDVLLSDVMMRGINGIETAAEILKFHPECRVILISGHAETARSLAEDYPGKPDFEILRKPIHPLILLDRIRETMPGAPGPSHLETGDYPAQSGVHSSQKRGTERQGRLARPLFHLCAD